MGEERNGRVFMKDTCKEILKKCGWERCIVAAFLLLVMVESKIDNDF